MNLIVSSYRYVQMKKKLTSFYFVIGAVMETDIFKKMLRKINYTTSATESEEGYAST